MLERLQLPRRESREREKPSRSGTERESVVRSPLFRVSRVLFGGILAFMAMDNLRNLDERVQYAESKGAPRPNLAVPSISAGLLLGGVGVTLWRLPSLAAAAVASFFASVTPVMHDFWNHEDPERQQEELIHFLKNTALLGATLAFLKLGRRT